MSLAYSNCLGVPLGGMYNSSSSPLDSISRLADILMSLEIGEFESETLAGRNFHLMSVFHPFVYP